MRVAFLGHNQSLDEVRRPSGGHLTREDAEQLVRDFLAERISQKAIRAFAPGTSFRTILEARSVYRFGIPGKLPPAEVENCKFVPPLSLPRPSMAAIRAGWDWSTDQIAI